MTPLTEALRLYDSSTCRAREIFWRAVLWYVARSIR